MYLYCAACDEYLAPYDECPHYEAVVGGIEADELLPL